ERLARLSVERKIFAFDRLRAGEKLLERFGIEPLEHHDARAREKRRDQLEGGILRGSADKYNGAVFHDRQERVLLRAVEAMDLVDEKKRALPGFAARAGGIEHLLEIADAGENCRDLLEMQIRRLRQEPRDRRLASAGRSPKNQGAERACTEQARERAVRAE